MLFALCLLLLFSSAYAAVFLIEPVDRKLQGSETVALGNIAKGETLRMAVRKKSELAVDWDTIVLEREGLPQGWSFNSIETDKSIIAEVKVPANATVSTQRLEFTLSNKAEPAFAETFYAILSVRDNLLTITMENLAQQASVGQTASFRLIASNDSIAEHSLAATSSLPSYWFQPRELSIPANSTAEVDLNVNALAYGKRNFTITVSSLQNNAQRTFPAELGIAPTLRGKYLASLFGFPFFSPSLLPYYLVNGFLSLLSKPL